MSARVASIATFGALALICASVTLGCAELRPMTASDDDLADYSAFRVAAYEGTRLWRAQWYLEAHPQGAWADEVRAAFDAEEPPYFTASQATRAKIRDYLISLPRGPHADAAYALLLDYDTKVEDIATARLMSEARHTEAMLASAADRRRLVGERVLADVAALLDPRVYAGGLEDTPPLLRRTLQARATWGGVPPRRERDWFFTLPTRPERQSRVATVVVAVAVDAPSGRITEGRVEGPDLFVRWAEADTMSPLDPTRPDDRAIAAEHARELLAGAFEARLPEAECRVPPGGDALLERSCGGWSLIVRMAPIAGGTDAVVVRGPAPVRGGAGGGAGNELEGARGNKGNH